MSEESNKMPRREFLQMAGRAAAGLALTGMAVPEKAFADDKLPPRDLSTLKEFNFKGQDGKPVDVDALLADLKKSKKTTTMTFGFHACTAYCPFTNGTLGAMDEKAPDGFKHIVIAMLPKEDGATQASRNGFLGTVKSMMNMGRNTPLKSEKIPDNVIILYPPDSETSVKIEKAFDNLVGRDPQKHTPNVDVFNMMGSRIAKGVPESVPAKGEDDLEAKAQAFANSVLEKVKGRGK
jgi:hypothetical protein